LVPCSPGKLKAEFLRKIILGYRINDKTADNDKYVSNFFT